MYTIVLNLSSEHCLTGKLSYGIYITMNSTEINTSRTATVNTPDHSTVTTTSNHSEVVTTLNRTTLIRALAVIGFIALVGITMWLAVYSTRYVPGIVGRIGSAAVYLSSGVIPSPTPSLSVVPTPTASTTIPFSEASSTIPTSTATSTTVTTSVTTTSPAKAVPPILGPTSSAYPPTRGTPTTGATSVVTQPPYGLSDLTVTVDAVGYLMTGNDTSSFTIGSPVPTGKLPAVMVTVANIGTNWTGTWNMSVSFPGTSNNFESLDSIAPYGGSNSYILSADRVTAGTNQPVIVTVDPDNTVAEQNENNNTASVSLTIL
jgi:hypothetical protein